MRRRFLGTTWFAAVAAGLGAAVGLVTPSTALAAFPGANGKIAYVHQIGMTSSAIYSASSSGASPKNLSSPSNPSARTADFQPAWAPKGKQIAFVRADTTNCSGQIWTMNPDGTDQRDLSNDPTSFSEINPAYGPDGSIVFVRAPKGTFDICNQSPVNQGNIWVRKPNGALKQLTSDGLDSSPVFSPDGSLIAFTRNSATPGSPPQIMITFANGSQSAKSLGPGVKPNWSPDGTKIVFAAPGNPGGPTGGAVTVINSDGTHRQTLNTTGTAPVWSPDGLQIAFLLPTGQMSSAIAVMNANGTNPHPITTPGSGNSDVKPDWQPVLGKLRFTVSPREATAGRLTCFRFSVHSSGRGLPEVRITFVNHVVFSSRRGTARVCARLERGVHIARAARVGYHAATARVRVH